MLDREQALQEALTDLAADVQAWLEANARDAERGCEWASRAPTPVHDPETGETLQSIKADNERKAAIIKGLERDIRGWMAATASLSKTALPEAREHALWPLAHRLFVGWRSAATIPKTGGQRIGSGLSSRLAHPRWGKTLELRVVEVCRAIAGAEHDCYRSRGAMERCGAGTKGTASLAA